MPTERVAFASTMEGMWRALQPPTPLEAEALARAGYLPGQFTTIADLEGEAVGALEFAGEHADSFYSWQGFMEPDRGALPAGQRRRSLLPLIPWFGNQPHRH